MHQCKLSTMCCKLSRQRLEADTAARCAFGHLSEHHLRVAPPVLLLHNAGKLHAVAVLLLRQVPKVQLGDGQMVVLGASELPWTTPSFSCSGCSCSSNCPSATSSSIAAAARGLLLRHHRGDSDPVTAWSIGEETLVRISSAEAGGDARRRRPSCAPMRTSTQRS